MSHKLANPARKVSNSGSRLSLAILTLVLFAAGPVFAETTPRHDPIHDVLTPPDVVLNHQQELGLSEDQVKSIHADVMDAQGRFATAQPQLEAAVAKLASLLKDSHVDPARALAQLDEVLRLEREVKHVQLTLMIQVKNTLTAQQQAQAHKFASEDER
jgi:Spy/CpxP family protein refolding chaperone